MPSPISSVEAVRLFLAEETLDQSMFWLPKSHLYQAYVGWAVDAPMHFPLTKKGLGVLVKAHRPMLSSRPATRDVVMYDNPSTWHVERPYCWVGLRLVWPIFGDPFEDMAATAAENRAVAAAADARTDEEVWLSLGGSLDDFD